MMTVADATAPMLSNMDLSWSLVMEYGKPPTNNLVMYFSPPLSDNQIVWNGSRKIYLVSLNGGYLIAKNEVTLTLIE